MDERPMLSKETSCEEFLRFYYLKEELVVFCRENELPTNGGNQELTWRVL